MTPSHQVVDYVETTIIPRYSAFDPAHRQDHVRAVIDRSLELAAGFRGVNADMVYITAAFHDLGLAFGRQNHHRDSRRILESDGFVRARFSPRQIAMMGRAVEDHRASSGHRPRNRYGLIVAEADRLIEPATIIRRTVQYGLAHYPDLDRGQQFRRMLHHLMAKYGPDGYLEIWIPWSGNAARLAQLRDLLADADQIAGLFDRIFDQERAAMRGS